MSASTTAAGPFEIFDVVIVGGGPVGACAGALLARELTSRGAPLKAAILEPHRPSALKSDAPRDLRVSAFSRASERVLTRAGVWDRIVERGVSPYERMRVWHESVAARGPSALTFDAAELGEPNLGYLIENRNVQSALLDLFETAGGTIVAGEVSAVHIQEDRVDIETSAGKFMARLIIGADGARSAVRDLVGLTADFGNYHQTAIVANVNTELPHESTAWQRFMKSGTLAFLPLSDGASSIVWSVDDELAADLLALDAGEFEHELTVASDRALAGVTLASERLSFPLRKVSAHRYVAQRCALIGDAAHVVHPLAGQGVNLGLLDAAALLEVLLSARAEREDPGALRLLRRYERWRKSENELIGLSIDGFNRFLAHGANPLGRIAQRGLGLVNRSREIKGFFMRRALGLTGELPAAARASL
jgi:2-octaprenylphenol hydroxylase